MKSINNYISEKLQISSKGKHYNYFPETKDELEEIIKQRIEEKGNECNLNDINVSKITDMSFLFFRINDFNGDISEWDVSNVKDMGHMFAYSHFNSNISEWNVSNVWNMDSMFHYSKFNKDISNWDVSNVIDMGWMFRNSKFNQDISKWDISNVKHIDSIFYGSPLAGKEKEWWNK